MVSAEAAYGRLSECSHTISSSTAEHYSQFSLFPSNIKDPSFPEHVLYIRKNKLFPISIRRPIHPEKDHLLGSIGNENVIFKEPVLGGRWYSLELAVEHDLLVLINNLILRNNHRAREAFIYHEERRSCESDDLQPNSLFQINGFPS